MDAIISGVVVQYSQSSGYVLACFGLRRQALNSGCPLHVLTFPTNSWTDLMLTGNLFMFKSEMLHVYNVVHVTVSLVVVVNVLWLVAYKLQSYLQSWQYFPVFNII
jgi:hypothetical protein